MTFDEFLDAELTGLRKYATALTGDPHRAHDVLADALLRAHTGWPRIGAMEFPGAYVRRMVTSEFLSEKRRWSVRMIRPTTSGELPDTALPDPTRAIDDRAQLSGLLSALPPRQRAAVVLRYYLGLSNEDIAAELRITVGAARTAISRGLAALRIAGTGDEAATAAAPRHPEASPTSGFPVTGPARETATGPAREAAADPDRGTAAAGPVRDATTFDLSPARARTQEGS